MNPNVKTILLAAAVSVFAAAIVSVKMQPGSAASDPRKNIAELKTETAFDRVAESKTLRCGYIVLPPEFNKDPNTGKFSGFSYDAAMEMGKRLGWNVQWTEEVNFMTMTEGLKTGRFDALCFSLYRYSPTAAIFDYSIPLFYTGTGVYVRADDSRFNADIKNLNDPSVTIATIDSEMSQIIAPQNPIRVFSHGFAFKKGEDQLVSTINYVFEEMHNDGMMEKILAAHEKSPGTFLRASRAYQSPSVSTN